MAVKQKRITCARCGERETVTRGERGPASIYCDLCRDEVKREQAALRAQAYRQRKASYGGGALTALSRPGRGFWVSSISGTEKRSRCVRASRPPPRSTLRQD